MLVADHRLGDRPDDPKDPAARMHVVRFELTAETHVGGRARGDATAGGKTAIAERSASDGSEGEEEAAPDGDPLRSDSDSLRADSASLRADSDSLRADAGSLRFDAGSLRSDAEAALTQMGWKPAISRAAVAAAIAGRHPTLEALVVAALQRCPRHVS